MALYKKKASETHEEAQEKASETRQEEEAAASEFGQAAKPAGVRELRVERVVEEIAESEEKIGELGRLSNEIAEDLGLPELAHKFWKVGAEFKVLKEHVGLRRELSGLVAKREERARAKAGESPKTRGKRFVEKVSELKQRMGKKAIALGITLMNIRNDPIPYIVETAKGVRDSAKGAWRGKKEFEELMGSMTKEYVGERTYERVSKDPIVVVRANPRYFELKAKVKKEKELEKKGATEAPKSVGRIRGFSRSRTNNVVINKGIGAKDERMKTLCHELLHAISWRGGSHVAGVGEKKPYVLWLHEGLTEMHAQQKVRSLGYNPKSVSYGERTAVSLFLQKIAGEEELRKAYFSGHFETVSAKVDAALGAGAFEEIISAKEAKGAIKLINKRIGSAAGGASLDMDKLASLNEDDVFKKTRARFGKNGFA